MTNDPFGTHGKHGSNPLTSGKSSSYAWLRVLPLTKGFEYQILGYKSGYIKRLEADASTDAQPTDPGT